MITTGTIKNIYRTFVLIIMSLAVQTAWGAYNPVTPLPEDTWTNHKATAFSSGSGTQADPWLISTPEELAFLAYQVTNNKSINSVSCKSAYYSLTADLDLKDYIWVPIGNLSTGSGNSFNGNFEGNGHVIKNMMLKWEVTNSTQAIGLFSTLYNGAIVQNLILDNAYIYNKATVTSPTADRLVAPFAGAIQQNTKIQNVIVKNTKVEVAEAYNQNSRWMLFGGFIAKALNKSDNYNLSNIYVDTDIDITGMTINKEEAVYSSLFIPEYYSNIKSAPKNIYLKGSILASAALTKVGPVFGTNLPSSSTYKSTWQLDNSNTYQYTTDAGTTKTDLTLTNAGGVSVASFDNSSFNTYAKENDLSSWSGSVDDPILRKVIFPEFTKTRDESIRNNRENVCTVTLEDEETGNYSYEWYLDDVKQESATTKTLTVTSTNKVINGKVKITNDSGYDYTLGFTVDPLYYSIDLYADEYAGGDGTADNPYRIIDDLQLAKLARDVNNGNKFNGTYFKLGADITLDKALWLPISQWDDSDSKFGGKFDGDGHTISNMHLQWEASPSKWVNWGLFGSIMGTADNIENYASVTNLIMENAVAEMNPNGTMSGQGLNVGIVSGELYPYAEISNIILKGCRITDNENEYSTTVSNHRIGGIVGNVEAQDEINSFRIFNISADTEVDVFVNATTNSKQFNISSGIGRSNFKTYTDAVKIFPKNIYLHGTAVKTMSSSTTNLYCGTMFGRNQNLTPTTAQQETWYYSFETTALNNVLGTYLDFTDDNAKIFQSLVNKYITDNSLDDKLLWSYDSENKYYFGSIDLTATTDAKYTVSAPAGSYEWYLSSDKVNWTKVESGISEGTNVVEIPYQEYNQYVYAKSPTGISKVLTIPALRIEAVKLNHEEDSKDYSVSVVNSLWGNDNSNLDVSYSWYINYDSSNETNTPVSTGYSYTYEGSDAIKDRISCHIVVTYNGKTIADSWVGNSRIIYLCPDGVTIGDKTYAAGNDDNDGLTPDFPKLTWQGAYAALSEEGSWDENKIVLMGTSDYNATFSTTAPYKGFAITANLSDDNLMGDYSTWKTKVDNSKLNRNTTISGKHGAVDYKGVIEMKEKGNGGGLGLFGDTRFEYITFKHRGGSYDIIFCQYNNLEMGKGLIMSGFPDSPGYGTLDGAKTTSLQIFGGFNNDNRFYPLNTEELIGQMEESMPHGREGFTMTFLSGHYSAICVGGRQTRNDLNGLMGTANMPVKCTITMDIDRDWNDAQNTQGVHYDAGIIMAGNHEGAMFGDVDIIVKRGHVGRLVNGTLGAYRDVNTTINAPYNTYMGRASIKLDPRKDSNGKYIDSDIVVTELYGGSCGRGFDDGKPVDNPFYGYGKVVINGGTFKYLGTASDLSNILRGVFGAGAGGTNGIGDGENHTSDRRIGYWSGNIMIFGDYNTAKSNLLTYNCYNADTHTYTVINPLDTKTEVEINGGVFGTSDKPIDGVYAGGSGYMAPGLWSSGNSIPSPEGGNIYGKKGTKVVSMTINGGDFYCENGVFAGGRGTNVYYETKSYGGTASDYDKLGQIFGNVEMKINGGNFYCPVFGGGYGVADAKLKDTETVNTLS
ncbi:MAG: hypothetical protein ACI4V5_01535, partial [Prevotella sp.]